MPIDIHTFSYKTLDEIVISFDKAIPKNVQAQKAKLIIYLRTGNESDTTFYTKVRVIDDDDEFVHWTYAHRYPQSAISYNC